jgi:quercetin dioxygenase-like cupin family protein
MDALPRVLKWDDLPTDRPMPLIERRRVFGSCVMLSRVELSPGFVVPTHSHHNEQMVCVLSGRAAFVLHEGTPDEERVTLAEGHVLHLPPHTPHGCTVLEPTVILDVFSPPSEKTGVDRA